MIFKKLVSVISALAITISMFTGLTITANAAGVTYTLKFMFGESEIKTMSTTDSEVYNKYIMTGTPVESNEGITYVVQSFEQSFDFSDSSNFKVSATVKVREPQEYTVTLAAYSDDMFLGSIGKVQVDETLESYKYSYPAYIVYSNQLYKKAATGGSYTVPVEGTVTGNTTLNVGGYELQSTPTDATIQLQEPSGSPVEGASKGDAGTKVEFTLPKQGQYTVIARYKGSVTAQNGSEKVEFTDSSDAWTEENEIFQNTSSEPSTFTMTADDGSYIDYVVLIRTGDAMSTLSYSKNGDGDGTVTIGGTTLNDGSYKAVVGSSQTIAVTADSGSYIKNVSIEGMEVSWSGNESAKVATITMPADDATLKVEFGKLYTITIANSENGTVIANAQTAKEGAEIKFSASPNDGYVTGEIYVTGSKGESVTVENNNTFKMPNDNVTINVSFDKLRTVSLARAIIGQKGDDDNPGSISSDSPLTVSDEKAEVNVTANTARGYRFVKFVYVATPTEDEPIPELGYYGDLSDLEGYDYVVGNPIDNSTKGRYGEVTGTVTVPDHDITVIAVFEKLDPITFISSVSGGTLSSTMPEVYPGDTFSVNTTADEGYYKATEITVTCNDKTLEPDGKGVYTVPYFGEEEEYPETITLSANFEPIPQYEVTKKTSLTNTNYGDSTTYGTISVSGLIPSTENKAYVGSTITVSAVAENGYELVGIKVNDEELNANADGIYTFEISNDVTITAEFKWIDKLPENVDAKIQKEFSEDKNSAPASWYYGTLKGQGLAYVPFVSVTVNHNGGEMTKTALSKTTIASGDISIAVVIDKAESDVKNVTLSGLSEDTSQTASQDFDLYKPELSEEVE